MSDWQLLILAIIQGLTEFLPVSSSAHLILPSQILGWPDQGLAVDIAVHAGSLLAVVTYFRHDLIAIVIGSWDALRQRRATPEIQLALKLLIATIPAIFAGLLAGEFVEFGARSAGFIGVTTLLFGLLLGVADRHGQRATSAAVTVTFTAALLIGAAQALAIFPGVSRSGITITAALLLGLGYLQAARFSFLMSIPVTVAAVAYKCAQLLTLSAPVVWRDLLVSAVLSALAAYFAIAVFLRLLQRVGLMPFVWYRVILGGALCLWSFS